MTNQEVLSEVELGWRHPQPRDVNDNIYEWMLRCWKETPAERPTFEMLHRTFDGLLDESQGGYGDGW